MIRAINLDGMFVPTMHPEIEYTAMRFHGGECHIKLNTWYIQKTCNRGIS